MDGPEAVGDAVARGVVLVEGDRAWPSHRGYTGLCPRVYQSGESDRSGPLSKNGPRCLRWALIEATRHACHHPAYRDRYQRTRAESIWHMLSQDRPFVPAGAPAP
jgi:transposase